MDILQVAKRVSGLKKRYLTGNKYFPNLDLQQADLVGLEFNACEFTRSNFCGANLHGISLQQSYLTKANLSSSQFRKCNSQ